MLTSLLTVHDLTVGMIAIAATVGVVVRAWVSLRKTRLRERSLNERLTRALADSTPQQRPDIIRALGALAHPDTTRRQDPGSGDDTAGLPTGRLVTNLLTHARRQPPDKD